MYKIHRLTRNQNAINRKRDSGNGKVISAYADALRFQLVKDAGGKGVKRQAIFRLVKSQSALQTPIRLCAFRTMRCAPTSGQPTAEVFAEGHDGRYYFIAARLGFVQTPHHDGMFVLHKAANIGVQHVEFHAPPSPASNRSYSRPNFSDSWRRAASISSRCCHIVASSPLNIPALAIQFCGLR
jgi:hypothetical protein